MQTLRRLNHYKGLTSDHLEDVLRLTSDPSGYMLGQNVVGYLELDDQLWVHQSNALAQEMFPDLRVGSSFLPDVVFPSDLKDRLTRIYQVRLVRHGGATHKPSDCR